MSRYIFYIIEHRHCPTITTHHTHPRAQSQTRSRTQHTYSHTHTHTHTRTAHGLHANSRKTLITFSDVRSNARMHCAVVRCVCVYVCAYANMCVVCFAQTLHTTYEWYPHSTSHNIWMTPTPTQHYTTTTYEWNPHSINRTLAPAL